MASEHQSRTVDAVQTSLDIIEFLQSVESAGITEIADAVDRSKGTVHGHMATLVDNEYVVNDDGTYRLSLQYLDLAETVKGRLQIYDVVRKELDDLAEECGELAQFATEEHGKAVYIYKTEGEDAVQTASSVGNRAHLHCLSLGKAMLARMDESRVEAIVDEHGLPGFTDATITTRSELFEELEGIRERGYAFDREERIEGLRCVAAPITMNDEVMGAISISGPASRFSGPLYEDELPNLVTRSANVIEINAQFS
ncbi:MULTISPECIES: IclR family transcriptional regulator [Halomicrobium]|uniref:Transcriptional regulator, IclR family n=2 Tax=Halomicrobium mukohataei TaxID=57705 RepID=C7NXM6_HALMD|nr:MULTISPECIES: IclR family transcriptional regulator [Halomicrobium]ACV46464.1 transcriptional regulator, IclR family [Halomicrobium mukohataei DSM 12286]QCD65013.1 IclR family transcriptional regulator [Halomicrobium mukohataei]QFR19819.1 helix-turn-helix domain-containing protein [Halomicrobium sp. ZPS1]